MTYKIAIIGLGKIAMDQHIPAITKNKKFKLVAGISRNASLKDVPHFTTLSELLASKIKLDCLAICTPPSVRLQMALEALKAGLDVLIEKPPTPTIGELFAMQAFARKQKRVLYATWHSRMNAAVEEARVRLKGKRVTQLKITWREVVRHWPPAKDGFGKAVALVFLIRASMRFQFSHASCRRNYLCKALCLKRQPIKQRPLPRRLNSNTPMVWLLI